MGEIESFKQKEGAAPFDPNFHEVSDISENDKLPEKEEVYLQQSKKSIYYKKCLKFYEIFLNNEKARADEVIVDENVFHSLLRSVFSRQLVWTPPFLDTFTLRRPGETRNLRSLYPVVKEIWFF